MKRFCIENNEFLFLFLYLIQIKSLRIFVSASSDLKRKLISDVTRVRKTCSQCGAYTQGLSQYGQTLYQMNWAA